MLKIYKDQIDALLKRLSLKIKLWCYFKSLTQLYRYSVFFWMIACVSVLTVQHGQGGNSETSHMSCLKRGNKDEYVNKTTIYNAETCVYQRWHVWKLREQLEGVHVQSLWLPATKECSRTQQIRKKAPQTTYIILEKHKCEYIYNICTLMCHVLNAYND